MPSYTVATEKKSYQRKFQALCDQFIKKTNGSQFLKKHTEIVDNLLINLWINSKAYNYIENTHQLWLLTVCDLIIGKREYLPN